MVFHVCIIWEGEEVRTRYYQSEFMGHATAEKMVSVFETATSDLHACGEFVTVVNEWTKCELKIV